MGNSVWRHVVPYERDQRLRVRVFADGAYFKGYDYGDDEVPASLDELMERTGARTHSILDVGWIATLPPPTVPRTQLALFDSSEIYAASEPNDRYIPVGDTAEMEDSQTIFQLTPQELHSIFNTEKPTRWQVAAAEEALLINFLSKCVYVVIYEDADRFLEAQARPVQILFYGSSGGGG